MNDRPSCKIAFRPRSVDDDLEGREMALRLNPDDETFFRESVENAEALFAPITRTTQKEKEHGKG